MRLIQKMTLTDELSGGKELREDDQQVAKQRGAGGVMRTAPGTSDLCKEGKHVGQGAWLRPVRSALDFPARCEGLLEETGYGKWEAAARVTPKNTCKAMCRATTAHLEHEQAAVDPVRVVPSAHAVGYDRRRAHQGGTRCDQYLQFHAFGALGIADQQQCVFLQCESTWQLGNTFPPVH